MALIADILLIAGSLGAAVYCLVLSRRLRGFNDLETGMGGAVATLSARVDEMTRALEAARESARHSSDSLEGLTVRAEDTARRLELLVASLHDLPLGGGARPGAGQKVRARDRAPASVPAGDLTGRGKGGPVAAAGESDGFAPAPARPDDDGAPLSFIRSSRASTLFPNGAGGRATPATAASEAAL